MTTTEKCRGSASLTKTSYTSSENVLIFSPVRTVPKEVFPATRNPSLTSTCHSRGRQVCRIYHVSHFELLNCWRSTLLSSRNYLCPDAFGQTFPKKQQFKFFGLCLLVKLPVNNVLFTFVKLNRANQNQLHRYFTVFISHFSETYWPVLLLSKVCTKLRFLVKTLENV